MHQADGDVEFSKHAAGVGACRPVGGLGQLESLEQVGDPGGHACAGKPVQMGRERDVLPSGCFQIDTGTLRDNPDRLPYLAGMGEDVEPGDRGRTGVRTRQRGEDLHGGGLAGTVGSQQAEHSAGRDAEAQAIQCPNTTSVGLDQVGCLDRGLDPVGWRGRRCRGAAGRLRGLRRSQI